MCLMDLLSMLLWELFEIDKSKLSEGTTISIKYTAMEGDTDVKDT